MILHISVTHKDGKSNVENGIGLAYMRAQLEQLDPWLRKWNVKVFLNKTLTNEYVARGGSTSKPARAVASTETTLQTAIKKQASAPHNDSSPYCDSARAWNPYIFMMTRTALEDFQNRMLHQPTNSPWFVRNMVVLPRRPGEGHTCSGAESPWERTREWATREAFHPCKIPQLKVILDDSP
ncbi:hypothetical protein J6590_046920 [Homalodisca vitripennis]|nr:hypothetical protein J6590_046920 [Homalodisca vitripennis]